jgi:hypothetical protein
VSRASPFAENSQNFQGGATNPDRLAPWCVTPVGTACFVRQAPHSWGADPVARLAAPHSRLSDRHRRGAGVRTDQRVQDRRCPWGSTPGFYPVLADG